MEGEGQRSAPAPIGRSSAHKTLLWQLARVASFDGEILISGPSGVGKELYAQYIHRKSHRFQGPFVPVNCGALPTELFENELFGHVNGAFTGARPCSEGLVKEAEGGTLFFDEIDSLTPACQVKLLRFVQEKEFRRLGETRLQKADVRIIAATNSNLLAAVREGKFREDLFFRLRVIPVEVPALKERIDDIPALLEEFTVHFAELYGLQQITFTDTAFQRLLHYGWPGNIRELENCVHYLTCLQLDRPVEYDDLLLLDGDGIEHGDAKERTWELTEQPMQRAKREVVSRFEREYLENALRRSGGNISRAARASGKARRAFFELIRKHEIDVQDFRCMDPQSRMKE